MTTTSNFGFLVGIALFRFMMTFVLWGVVLSLDRVEKVNELPEDKRFQALGWDPGKRLRFEREYERLFPDRKLRHKERILMLLGMIALICAFLAIGWL
jgi:hypothetical protein